jgi:hypothetical protein
MDMEAAQAEEVERDRLDDEKQEFRRANALPFIS